MTARLRLTRQADADLDRLLGWLDAQNGGAARKAAAAIWAALNQLTAFPFSAPEVDGYREKTVRFGRDGFTVRYDASDDRVVVLAIFHGREDRRSRP